MNLKPNASDSYLWKASKLEFYFLFPAFRILLLIARFTVNATLLNSVFQQVIQECISRNDKMKVAAAITEASHTVWHCDEQ